VVAGDEGQIVSEQTEQAEELDGPQTWLKDHPNASAGIGCAIVLVIVSLVVSVVIWAARQPNPLSSDSEVQASEPSLTATDEPAPSKDPYAEIREEEGFVSKEDLRTKWPLTVKAGLLTCEATEAGGLELQIVTFIAPEGDQYALNGTAQSQTDLPAIDPIWKDDALVEGVKLNIGPLVDAGLALC